MKNLIIILFVFSTILFTSCEEEETFGSYTEVVTEDTDAPISLSDKSDAQGNIYIVNTTSSILYLYNQDKVLKEIPADSSRFLIYVPNDGFAKILKIWKKEDVEDINKPEEDKLFRRWDVVLDITTNAEKRATWIIKQNGGLASGTLTFNYSEESENNIPAIYSVDVFLNSKNGSKITSLSPGTENKKIGIEYGYHVIYYRYWYDDPGDTQGAEEIGWIEKDSDENIIGVVINANGDNKKINVPININSPVGRAGKLNISNDRNQDLQIFVSNDVFNSKPIEEIVISNVSITGLSYLEKNASYTFDIPEGEYKLEAKTLTKSGKIEVVQEGRVFVIMQNNATWVLDEEIEMKEIEITNNTNAKVTIHNLENGEYLGIWCESGRTKTFEINAEIESLKAINWFGVGTASLTEMSDTWIIEELPISLKLEYAIISENNDGDEIDNNLKVQFYTKDDGWQTLRIIEKDDVNYFQIFSEEISLPQATGTDFKFRFIQENISELGKNVFYIDDVKLSNEENQIIFYDDFSNGVTDSKWDLLDNISLNSMSNYCASTPFSMMLNGEGQREASTKKIWD